MTLRLTERDRDILETLTLRVPMLSLAMVLELWWPDRSSDERARRRLAELDTSGWISRYVVNAHPRSYPRTSLIAWRPGMPVPDLAHVTEICRNRWSRPAVPTDVIVATPLAASLHGSTARKLPSPEHRDRLLHLGSVYVMWRQSRPWLAHHWVGRDALSRNGFRMKDPDAVIHGDSGEVAHVIQAAGRCGPDWIERFHWSCAEWGASYELW